MKYARLLLPLLVLALLLSGCGNTAREPYDYHYNGKTLKVYPESATIVDGLNVYRYTADDTGSGVNYEIVYPNGGRYHWTDAKNGGFGGWADGYNDKLYLSGDILVDALKAGQPREKVGNIGLGLLLMGLGAWYTLSPESVFYLSKGWMFRDAEPSDSYLTLARISGGVFALVGLIACLI